jgi:hypothetical protein
LCLSAIVFSQDRGQDTQEGQDRRERAAFLPILPLPPFLPIPPAEHLAFPLLFRSFVKSLFAAWLAFALLLLGVGRLTMSTGSAGHGPRDARTAHHTTR